MSLSGMQQEADDIELCHEISFANLLDLPVWVIYKRFKKIVDNSASPWGQQRAAISTSNEPMWDTFMQLRLISPGSTAVLKDFVRSGIVQVEVSFDLEFPDHCKLLYQRRAGTLVAPRYAITREGFEPFFDETSEEGDEELARDDLASSASTHAEEEITPRAKRRNSGSSHEYGSQSDSDHDDELE